MTQTDFTGADLARTDLTQADLTQTDLTQTDLTKTGLTRATIDPTSTGPAAAPSIVGGRHGAPAPGFDDPTAQAQKIFRAVLDALARPGRRNSVVGIDTSPEPLGPLLGAVALTLFDDDCGVWLGPELAATPEVRAWLAFHTGARIVDDPRDAAFVVTSDPASVPPLDTLAAGTDDAPHLSATVVVSIPRGSETTRHLGRGPGIESVVPIDIPVAWTGFTDHWHTNTSAFPRGVDVLFVVDDHVWGLPRTTRLDREVS